MISRLWFGLVAVGAAWLFLLAGVGRAQQPTAVAPNPPAAAGAAAQAPGWYPLPKDHAEYLDKVLAFWEFKSKETQRYRCRFKRWEYDPDWVGSANVAKTYAEGAINYAAPDKGMFRVEKSMLVTLPVTNPQEPKYTANNDTLNEHWVCDGKSVFEFDGHNKNVIQRELPPNMQGKQIVEGPLPFLFGASAASIKARYWIRAIIPPPRKGVFWLEAEPKSREDAANFKRVHIIIAGGDFLPEGLVLFHRANATTTFAFENRERNWNDLIEKLNLFHRQFFEPATPSGWKKIVEKYQEPATVPVSAPAPAVMPPVVPPRN
jgi:TIGR03009 family protein